MFAVIVTGIVAIYAIVYADRMMDETDPASRAMYWLEAKYFKLKKIYGKKVR